MSKNNRICTKSHCACLKAISICAVEKGKKVMIDRSNRSFFFLHRTTEQLDITKKLYKWIELKNQQQLGHSSLFFQCKVLDVYKFQQTRSI